MFESIKKGFGIRRFRGVFLAFLFVFCTSFAIHVSADDTEKEADNIFFDTDSDGLSNEEEKLYGTDPLEGDSDGDSYQDGVEVNSGYDPLKPAPGDKISLEEFGVGGDANDDTASEDNLTQKLALEINETVNSMSSDSSDISMSQVDSLVQDVLGGTLEEELVLPDIDISKIKVKKISRKGLSESEYKEKERAAASEYTSVVFYIMATRSPREFKGLPDLQQIGMSMIQNGAVAYSTGNEEFFDEIEKNAKGMMSDLEEIDVPEVMLEAHVKALKLAKYGIELKNEIKIAKKDSDPIGSIKDVTKFQGYLGAVNDFVNEVQQKMQSMGIDSSALSF